MYEIEEFKYNFADKNSVSFCQACLSSDRSLSSIGDYVDVLRHIISNNIQPQPLLLCWECIALLKKIKLFKDKYEEAQRILTYHYLNKKKLLLQTLSNLTKTYNGHAIFITHDEENDECERKIEKNPEHELSNDSFNNFDENDLCVQETIKEDVENGSSETVEIATHDEENNDSEQKIKINTEHELSNESFNNFDENDLCVQKTTKEDVENGSSETVEIARNNESKAENVEDAKLKKYPYRKKPLHYRIFYEKDLTKKVAIQPEESKIWIEREKSSDFYKKLRYKCKLCLNGFDTKEKFESHVLKYHDESAGSHVCPTCSIRFTSESLLSAHTQTHDFAWECSRCVFQCYSLKRLNAHIKIHRAFQCVYCEAKFEDLTTFYIHNNTFHSTFICDYCKKQCRTKYMIEKHIRRHLEKHICTTCSKHYKTRETLKAHISERHSGCAPEQAYCVLCDKQYVSNTAYRRHVNTSAAHMKESQCKNRVQCPECSNTYSRRVYMMNHYRHVHKNQSKHNCLECDKHFLNRTKYLDHMRYKHEGVKKEKNKLCNICGRGFADKTTLQNHIRTHTGERPYKCEHCAAKFTQRYAMLTHVKFIHMKSKRKPQ